MDPDRGQAGPPALASSQAGAVFLILILIVVFSGGVFAAAGVAESGDGKGWIWRWVCPGYGRAYRDADLRTYDQATWQARATADHQDRTADLHTHTAGKLRRQAGAQPGETGDQSADRLHRTTLDQLHDSLTRVRTDLDQLLAETTHRDRLSPTEHGLEEHARLLAALHSRPVVTRGPSYGPSPDYTPQPGWHPPPPHLGPGPRGPCLGR